MDIKSLSAGMIVEDIFAVLKVEQADAASGKKYLKAELSHKTGSINAKVWEESFASAPLKPNQVYRISARTDVYKGTLGLIINNAYLVQDENIEDHLKKRRSLIFDIETAGADFDTLDEWSKEYLLEKLQGREEDKEKAKEKTALYPLFGQVVAVGMLNPVTGKGKVLLIGEEKLLKSKKLDDGNFTFELYASEEDLLHGFWEMVEKFEHFITFNGMGFDWPYLIFRSAINKVRVPIEITRSRDQQTDLMEKFKVGNVYSLEALCRSFGISNPKEKGVSGLHVSKLFEKGKILDIANYVSRDVVSTGELYQIWKKFMAGKIVL